MAKGIKKASTKGPAKRAVKNDGPARPRYSVAIISDVLFTPDLKTNLLKITYERTFEFSRLSSTGEVEAKDSQTHVQAGEPIPLDIFKDVPQLNEFCSTVRRMYHETLPELLAIEAGQHLNLILNEVLNSQNILKIDMVAHIDNAGKRWAQRVKDSLSLPVRGRHSQWTPAELTFAIRAAMNLIPPHEKKDYENVAAKLKESHPEKAPKSGEALRALVKRSNLKWKDLKSGQ